MRRLAKILILAGTLLSALPASAQPSPEAIVDYPAVPYATTSGKRPSDAEVRTAIRQASRSLGWSLADGQNSESLIGTLMVRNKHTIQVNIQLQADNYSVTYRDSVNMNYVKSGMSREDQMLINWRGATNLGGKESPVIHPNYNRWVKDLVNAINRGINTL